MYPLFMAGQPASRFEYHPAWQFPTDRFMDEAGICPADTAHRNDDDNLENKNVSGGQAFPDAGKHEREKAPEIRPPSQPGLLDQPNPPTADPDYRQYPPETAMHDPNKAYPPTDPVEPSPEPEVIEEPGKKNPEVVPPPDGFYIPENSK